MSVATTQSSAIATRGRLRQSVVRENIAGFLFISPWIIGFLGFEFGPLLAAIYLAFAVSTPSNSQFLQLFLAWLFSGFSLRRLDGARVTI